MAAERMADVSEKVAGHLESMDANEILSRSSQVEKIDNVARRTFGLDIPASGSDTLNLNVLIWRTCDCADQPKERVVQICARVRKSGLDVRHRFFPGLLSCAMDTRTLQRKNNNSLSRRDRSGGTSTTFCNFPRIRCFW